MYIQNHYHLLLHQSSIFEFYKLGNRTVWDALLQGRPGSQKNARHLVRYQPIRSPENGLGQRSMDVTPAISHYVKKALVGTNFIKSVNSFKFLYVNAANLLVRNPVTLKVASEACAKGIAIWACQN